ncbi:unnamed protein product [Caenorhabditis brenneri]
MLLNLIIIGIAFVGAHAEKECTFEDEMKTFMCAEKMMNFATRVGKFNLNSEEESKGLQNSCDDIKNCFNTFGHCELLNNEDSKFLFKIIKSYCTVFNRVKNHEQSLR